MTKSGGRAVLILISGVVLAAGVAQAAVRARVPEAGASKPTVGLGGLFRLPAAEREPVWSFEGRDVDGDGAPDFANPTGEAPRDHDAFGGGHYGASRGARDHAGVDYVAEAGQTVAAPISGFVTRIGYCYGDEPGLRYIEIRNPALNLSARVFYVDSAVKVGDAVRVGRPIGRAATLQDRYPGITDHVHLEIRDGERTLDATDVIVARLESPPRGRG